MTILEIFIIYLIESKKMITIQHHSSLLPSLDKGIHGRKRVNFVTCGVTFNRRTPIEDNAAKRRNIVIEACVPLSREGTLGNILDTENRKYFLEYRVKNCNKNSDKYGLAAKIGSVFRGR